MSNGELNVKEVGEFLKLPYDVRWQVLFFGLIGVKRSVWRLELLAWTVLAAILTDVGLSFLGAK